MNFVTCLKCGTVHMGVTRAYAEAEVARSNAYLETLEKKIRDEMFASGPSTVTSYETCWCGSKEMRPTKPGDCPDGVTIGPVIWEPA